MPTPIIAGPWCSEVGYEVLYWIPFLRWVMEAYRIPRERIVAVSRGGTASWYDRIASRYVEIFDHVATGAAARHAAVAGSLKQHQVSDLDREIADSCFERRCSSLHPRRCCTPR